VGIGSSITDPELVQVRRGRAQRGAIDPCEDAPEEEKRFAYERRGETEP
jgi:hypothetical protein